MSRRPPGDDGPSPLDEGAASDVGRRPDNQDRCHVDHRLAVVSDGMGGHAGGEVAAARSVAAVTGHLERAHGAVTADDLRAAFDLANASVRRGRASDPSLAQMGATLTVAARTATSADATSWLVAHVGDSPAFVVRNGSAAPLTADHNAAGELLAAGALTEEQAATSPARHLLLRAIGTDEEVRPDLTEVELGPGDALVLTSDGVSGSLSADELAAIVEGAETASDAAGALVQAALAAGATDNATAVVVRHRVPSSTHGRTAS